MLSLILSFFKKAPQPKFKVKGRDEWYCYFGPRKMIIYVEKQASNYGVEIDFRSIQNWLPPFEEEMLSYDERESILKALCLYFDKRHIKYKIRNYGRP